MSNEPKYYGVSTGDGNNGVSHMFPNYIVKTDDPWKLAEAAALAEFNESGKEWSKENMDMDGDEEYCISVTFPESPETQKEYSELEERLYGVKCNEPEDKKLIHKLERELENFGCDCAWFIVDVFPIEEAEPEKEYRCPVYDSPEDAGL